MEFEQWKNVTTDQAEKTILKDINILDVGCGHGHLARGLAEWGVGKIDSIDAS